MEWFWAAWYFGQDKRGVSALLLSKLLGRRYETVWNLLQKLRAALAEDEKLFPLEGVVEVDEVYLGGKTTKAHGGRSLRDPRRSLVVGAAERVPVRAGRPGVRGTGTRCGSARLSVVPDASRETLVGFLGRTCGEGTTIASDGWRAYERLGTANLKHLRVVIGNPENASEVLPLVHTLFSNLQTWLAGTFHGVSKKWLSRYVQEFTYRLNRRYRQDQLWHYVLRRAVTRPWVPEANLALVSPQLAA